MKLLARVSAALPQHIQFIAIVGFLPLAFAGYWLMAEVYAYSQQMGITAMGGVLAWLFIIQAVLIGTIMLAVNYYLWCGLMRTDRGSQYALFVLPIAFTWLMGLMGYIRSSLRTHWHVYTIMKDNSPEAFIPTIGQAGNTITIVTLAFMAVMVFVFWLSRLGSTKQEAPVQPAMAEGIEK